MKISIITPLYNARHFLTSYFDAVIPQIKNECELILIDDGSTDNTFLLLSQYEKINNIHIIHFKTNQGVSIARNKGLDMAKGEYVLFADGDDVLYPDALSVLHDALENTETDYLRYEYQTIDTKGNALYPNYEAKARRRVANQSLKAAECIGRIVRNEYFLWAGVFRKEIIDKYRLRFMEGCTYNEDTLFMLRFFMHSHSHIYLPATLYGYRKYEGAVTARFTEKNYQDVKKVAEIACATYNSCEDKSMKKALKPVIESLFLRIIETARTKHEDFPMIRFCCEQPMLPEWKMIRMLGYPIGRKCIPLAQIVRKIIRKFY